MLKRTQGLNHLQGCRHRNAVQSTSVQETVQIPPSWEGKRRERRDCKGTGSQLCGRSSPCDGIVHALVDSRQHPPIALANVVDVRL